LRKVDLSEINGLADLPVALPQFINEIPMGLLVLGLDRRVMIFNRALEALTGLTSQSAAGIPCHYLLRSNLCHRGCPVNLVSDSSEPICVEADIISRNRQRIPVRINAAPIVDLEGNLVAYLESVEDMRSLDPVDQVGRSFGFGKLIGASRDIQRIFQVLPVIAQTDSSVLITGQTGTGKDILAEAIHQASNRAKGPFIKVNCGALPETLLESELFGHQKGAFTGAVESKPGRFRLAHNGTLYLTEIGDLPLNLQVKLLSFLDDKVLYPLGTTKGIHIDVRVIAATHRNLEQMVREGRFREDLLFRLNVIRLHLPRLSARGDDVRMLMDHFLREFNSRFKKKIKGFSTDAHKVLLDYHYPGNVRELRNIVEYAANICDGDQIRRQFLPAYITEARTPEEGAGPYAPDAPNGWGGPQTQAMEMNWADTERKLILDAMKKAGGRRSKAAEILGWGRSTLWRKMKRHQIVE
jgi:two-component system, NtrC family, response regulator AtoC